MASLNIDINCLCLTEKHLAQGIVIFNAVHFTEDPNAALYGVINEEAKPLVSYLKCLIGT